MTHGVQMMQAHVCCAAGNYLSTSLTYVMHAVMLYVMLCVTDIQLYHCRRLRDPNCQWFVSNLVEWFQIG